MLSKISWHNRVVTLGCASGFRLQQDARLSLARRDYRVRAVDNRDRNHGVNGRAHKVRVKRLSRHFRVVVGQNVTRFVRFYAICGVDGSRMGVAIVPFIATSSTGRACVRAGDARERRRGNGGLERGVLCDLYYH